MSISDFGLLPKIAANHKDYSYHYQTTALYLHPLASALFSTNFRFEPSQGPLTASKPRQNHLPTRPQLLTWFSALSKEEVQLATAIDNAQFIEKFLKNYPNYRDKLIHLPSSRTTTNPFLTQSDVCPALLPKVRVAMLTEPLLYVEAEDSVGAATVKWLDTVSGGKAFDLPHRSLNRESPQQNLLWFNTTTFHPLHNWLANQLEKAILRYFFNPKDRINKLKIVSKHLMDKKIGKSYMQALEISLEQIKEGRLEEKGKVIEGLRHYEQGLHAELQQNILSLTSEKKKKKKKRSKREREGQKKQPAEIDQLQVLIEDLQDQAVPLLAESSVGLSTATDLRQDDVKKEFEQRAKFQHTQSPNANENPQHVVTQPFELDCLSCNFQNITCSVNSTTCTSPAKNKEDELENQDSCQDLINHYEANLSDSFQTFKLNRQSSEQIISNSEHADQKHDSDTFLVNQGVQVKTKRKRKRKTHKAHNKIVEQFKQKAVASLLNKQFTSMVDSLSTQSNSSYESKAIAFERVQYFVKSLYTMSESVLFGSNAVGLALPSSDIDIMLVHIPCQTKEQICDALAQIAIYINTMGWVTSCSTYFNAKVPLLKLQIDPSIPYFTPKRKTDYFGVNNPYLSYYLDMKQPAKAVSIKVDITISTQQGKVSASTELMRYWLQQKPSLQRVLLALKYSLSVRGYSENFKGGIGSYCLFVMIAAYFIHFKEKREESDCEILLDILKYYGQDFQNQLKIIALSEEGSCFVDNESGQHKYEISDQVLFNNLLKIIDPLNGKLMSSSCIQYNNIKAEWRRIRSEILKAEELVENEIEMCFSSNAEVGKLLANKKGFDRWVNKLQSRVEFSIARIIAGL